MPQVDRAIEILRMLPLEPVMQVEIKVLKDSKSLAQLRTVFMWLKEIQTCFQESQGVFYTTEELQEWTKGLFGVTEVLNLPDGKKKIILKSFSKYTMEEMQLFMNGVDHYCGSELHIYLTIPGNDF